MPKASIDHLKQQPHKCFINSSPLFFSDDIIFMTQFQAIKLSFSIFSVSPKVRIEYYNSQATNGHLSKETSRVGSFFNRSHFVQIDRSLFPLESNCNLCSI